MGVALGIDFLGQFLLGLEVHAVHAHFQDGLLAADDGGETVPVARADVSLKLVQGLLLLVLNAYSGAGTAFFLGTSGGGGFSAAAGDNFFGTGRFMRKCSPM